MKYLFYNNETVLKAPLPSLIRLWQSQHYHIERFKGAPNRLPLCCETPVSRTANVIFFSSPATGAVINISCCSISFYPFKKSWNYFSCSIAACRIPRSGLHIALARQPSLKCSHDVNNIKCILLPWIMNLDKITPEFIKKKCVYIYSVLGIFHWNLRSNLFSYIIYK